MLQFRSRAQRARRWVLFFQVAVVCAVEALAQRPVPDTTDGIHVFNDQIMPGITAAQVDFSARHYAGTQKVTLSDANRFRAVNPDFLVLHYRLGMGLGYRQITAPCFPGGGYFSVIDGNTWVQEWPGDGVVQEPWFFHWQNQRVLQCQWGWYLMDPSDASWRQWWSSQVLLQLEHNDADGLFADSFMVPNYMGGFSPELPSVDFDFESTWSAKLASFMTYMRERFDGQYLFIPNVGKWVTTRDQTDFSLADGVFVEEFGYDVWEQWGLEAFTTQSDRLLSLIAQDKVVIGQSYRHVTSFMRMHTLANYLLIKGKHTFLNLEISQAPEWWPEYDIPIGSPLSNPPASTSGLWDAANGVYARDYSNGRVLLNAGVTGRTVPLGTTLFRAQAAGGGNVPATGVPPSSWTVSYTPVSSVALQPGEAAVLLVDPTPHRLDVPILFGTQPASLRVSGATPNRLQVFFVSRVGPGTAFVSSLSTSLDIARPLLLAQRTASASGITAWTYTPSFTAIGRTLWFQVAELGHVTNVQHERVH